MHRQDGRAPFEVGRHDHDAPIETPRPEQGIVEDVGAVRCRQHNDAFIRTETVHLNKELVQGLLALVMTAAQTRSAVTSHGVNFIDEDDAGGFFLRV